MNCLALMEGSDGSVRVITGQAKGARLRSSRDSGLRPTSSLVRNAIFSTLQSRLATGSRVLDLYAGTGSLGIEALSRGADHVDFVECNNKTAKLIEENLTTLNLRDHARVFSMPALRALPSLNEQYDLIMMDPPYELTEAAEVLQQVVTLKLLEPEAVVVVEHAWRNGAPQAPIGLVLEKTRRYGDTAVTYYSGLAS